MNDIIVVKIDKARSLLAEARTAQDAKKVVDLAHAAEVYAKRQKLSEEAIEYAHEIRIEAMRLLGDFLKSSPKARGTQGQLVGKESSGGYKSLPPEEDIPTYADLGIDKREAAESQFLSRLAEISPEVFDKVKLGEVSMPDAKREMKRKEVVEKLENIAAKEAKKVEGIFDVVVIDPPWPMQKIERDERPNQSEFEYPTMELEEIAALDIPCANDCHVWMWTTQKFLPSAFDILKAWGLNYVCTFVWHKPGGYQPFELPQYNCEFVLYARKGAPKFIDTKAFPTCFDAPRGKHSEKPDEFYNIVRRVTAGRRLDMFSRREIEGFEAWGNEA